MQRFSNIADIEFLRKLSFSSSSRRKLSIKKSMNLHSSTEPAPVATSAEATIDSCTADQMSVKVTSGPAVNADEVTPVADIVFMESLVSAEVDMSIELNN